MIHIKLNLISLFYMVLFLGVSAAAEKDFREFILKSMHIWTGFEKIPVFQILANLPVSRTHPVLLMDSRINRHRFLIQSRITIITQNHR